MKTEQLTKRGFVTVQGGTKDIKRSKKRKMSSYFNVQQKSNSCWMAGVTFCLAHFFPSSEKLVPSIPDYKRSTFAFLLKISADLFGSLAIKYFQPNSFIKMFKIQAQYCPERRSRPERRGRVAQNS